MSNEAEVVYLYDAEGDKIYHISVSEEDAVRCRNGI